jgi:hypothetical protein
MSIAKKLSDRIVDMQNLQGHDNAAAASAFRVLSEKSGDNDGGIAYFNMILNYLTEIESRLIESDRLEDHQREAFLSHFRHAKSLFGIENLPTPWATFKGQFDLNRVSTAMNMIDYFFTSTNENGLQEEEIIEIKNDLEKLRNSIDNSDISLVCKRLIKNDIEKLFNSINIIDSIGEAEFIKRYKSLASDFASISDIILKSNDEDIGNVLKRFIFRGRRWLGLTADIMQVTGVSGPAPALIGYVAQAT